MATGPIGPFGPTGPQGQTGIQGRVGHQGTPYGPPGYSFYSPGGVAYISNVRTDFNNQYFVNLASVPYGGFLTVGSKPPGSVPWTSIDFPSSAPPAGAFWTIRWAAAVSQNVPLNNGTIDQYPSGSITTYPQGTSTTLRIDTGTYVLMYSGSGSNYILF